MAAGKKVDVLGHRALTPQEIRAIKATWAGEATPDQQRQSLSLVMTVFAQVKKMPVQPGDPFDTAVLNGRLVVGQMLANVIELPVEGKK